MMYYGWAIIMVLKLGPNRPIMVLVWSGQLGWKVVIPELDQLNRWSDRQTGWFRWNRPIQLFFFLPLSPLPPAHVGKTLLARWNPLPRGIPLCWKSRKDLPLFAHQKAPHLAVEVETLPPKTSLEPFFVCSSTLFFHIFSIIFYFISLLFIFFYIYYLLFHDV